MTIRIRTMFVIAVAFAVMAGCESTRRAVPTATDRAPNRYTIEQFLAVTDYAGASFSSDGSRILVSSDQTGVFNAWVINVARGESSALTESTSEAIEIDSFFPTDDRFLYHADQEGDELDHIYVRERDGTIVDLTPGEKLKASFLNWARDDRTFFVATNERDNRYFDLYEYQVEGYAREMIYRDETGLQIEAISDDKRYIAFDSRRTTFDSDVLVYDRQTHRMRNLTEHEGAVANETQGFGPDSRSLYFTTDEDHEFAYLVRFDLESGERRVVVRADWDVQFAEFSRHGTYLVVGINNDARTEIRLYLTQTMQPVSLEGIPAGDISDVTFSSDETMIAFYSDSGRSPESLWITRLADGTTSRLVSGLSAEIDERDLVEGEVVRFASYDGLEIPGLLFRPHGASGEAKAPALVWVHGGPGGQSRVGYNGLVQYLVNHGYSVYAINNRGSSGYGKAFYRADDRRHGDADLDDCVAAKRMLVDRGWIDPEKIGIIGGSYGGYMVLAALAFRPDEFAVGVDLFGISNWVRTLESIPPWWESVREALYVEIGDPVKDRDALLAKSPLFHAGNIVRPLMVLQGANDPRVIKPESDDIVEAVRRNRVPVEYIVFDDEGHGFRKKENREEAYRRIREFLDVHLRAAR